METKIGISGARNREWMERRCFIVWDRARDTPVILINRKRRDEQAQRPRLYYLLVASEWKRFVKYLAANIL